MQVCNFLSTERAVGNGGSEIGLPLSQYAKTLASQILVIGQNYVTWDTSSVGLNSRIALQGDNASFRNIDTVAHKYLVTTSLDIGGIASTGQFVLDLIPTTGNLGIYTARQRVIGNGVTINDTLDLTTAIVLQPNQEFRVGVNTNDPTRTISQVSAHTGINIILLS
jgi:hypothetical protein